MANLCPLRKYPLSLVSHPWMYRLLLSPRNDLFSVARKFCVEKDLSEVHQWTSILKLDDEEFIKQQEQRQKEEAKIYIKNSVLRKAFFENQDPVVSHLGECRSLNDILKVVEENVLIMSPEALRFSLYAIHKHLLYFNDKHQRNFIKTKLMEIKAFKELCTRILRHVGVYQGADLIDVLFNISQIINRPNAGLVRATLQMARRNINSFDVRELLLLDVILTKMSLQSPSGPSKTLIDSLKTAIPLALDLRIESKQFYSNNMTQMASALKVAVDKEISMKSVNRLMTVILNNAENLYTPDANIILTAVASNYVEYNAETQWNLVEKVLNVCLEKISEFLETNDYELDIGCEDAFGSIARRDHPVYYNEDYTDAMFNMFEKNFNSLNIQLTSDHLLRYFSTYKHFSPKLLENITTNLIENPDLLLSPKRSGFNQVLPLFAEFFCIPLPEKWKLTRAFALDFLHRYFDQFPTLSPLKIFKALLILRDHDRLQSLVPIISSALTTPRVFLLEDEHDFHRDIIDINLGLLEAKDCISVEFKEQLISFVSPAIDYLSSTEEPSKFSCLIGGFTEIALNGSQYVARDVWTRHGHRINNLIMFDETDRAVAFPTLKRPESNDVSFLDQMGINSSCKMIALVPLTDADYSTKPYVLNGSVRLRLRTLLDLGIRPLTIHFDTWDVLADCEKLPFLLREIDSLLKSKQSVYDIFYDACSPKNS